MSGFSIKKEEYTIIDDLFLRSFVRDLTVFTNCFPKFNQTLFEDEGLATNFSAQCETHHTSLSQKSKNQRGFMKQTKKLIETHNFHYDEFFDYISKITTKRQLLFKSDIIQDENNISKNIGNRSAFRNYRTFIIHLYPIKCFKSYWVKKT